MEALQIGTLNNCIISAVCGFGFVLLFDVISTLIEILKIKNNTIIMFIKDIIFFVCISLMMLLIFYYCNKGAFRGLYCLSLLLGICIYFELFSKFIRKIINTVFKPIRFIVKIFKKIANKILKFLLFSIEKIEMKLYNINSSCKS